MKSFRIFVNNIELPHVREDAKIHDENSSFFEEIRVKHNTRPVRIKENEDTLRALGEFEISTAKKRKFFPCKVVIGAIRYSGILTQNERIPGFRKCDIKFGSEVNEIMDKPIANYFPKFSVIGEVFPRAYKEEAEDQFGFQQDWVDHAKFLSGKIYPEVHWQMPEIRYRDKFGTDLKNDDPHFYYRKHLNSRDVDGLVKNTLVSNATYFVVHNFNIVAPQVFWLSPIFYAFGTIGYKLTGSVPKHPFFKRLLLLSEKDNMTRVPVEPIGQPIPIGSVAWTQKSLAGVLPGIPYQTYVREVEFIPDNAGEYVVRYKMEISKPITDSNFYGVQIYKDGLLLASATGQYPGEFEGKLNFTVEEGQEATPFTFIYHSIKKNYPTELELGFYEDLGELDFYDMHPTIDFSRYIPDWTTADYLNKFQKLFNLKVDIDDIEKTIAINFNIEDYLLNGKMVNIFKSLQISEPKNIEAESYYLRYANDQDYGQFVALHEDVRNDENTVAIETDFKYLPYEQGRNVLSQHTVDKDGVGLMLYDPASHPGTVKSYAGINLSIPGTGGIFETFHKPWLLFRLNAANAVLKGPFSKTELYQISKYKKLYIDNQVWMVKSIDYKENSAALFETEIEVASVSF